jgi:hypothetical protein
MNEKSTSVGTLTLDVDTTGIERAAEFMERLAAAAERTSAALTKTGALGLGGEVSPLVAELQKLNDTMAKILDLARWEGVATCRGMSSPSPYKPVPSPAEPPEQK